MDTIIKVNQLKKAYKKTEVLKGISFDVNPGEIVALLGENGAGKSTLINIMNDIVTASSGSIELFDGEQNKREIKNRTGIMLQNNIIIQRLKVREVIELGRSYYPNALDYDELIEIADLKDLQDLEMRKLSGGQQRRLSFAMALVGNPELIFLDEPTASMDSRSRARLWQQVAKLKAQNKTIIVTSHYLEELEDIASRILILQNGLIAFDGSLQKLREIQGQATVEFDCTNELTSLNPLKDTCGINHQGDHYQITTQDVNQVIKLLYPDLDQIENLNIQQTTLETLFTYFRKEMQS